jgi:hypothetical protein
LLHILNFLGQSTNKVPVLHTVKSNKTLIPRNYLGKFIIKNKRYINKITPYTLRTSFLSKVINNNVFMKPPVQKESTLKNLRDGYKKDREILEQLINRSIKCWR